MTGLRWGSRTDVGQVRAVNQDNVYAQAPLFAVADGVGGAQGGEVASRIALETLVAAVEASSTENVEDGRPHTTLSALVAGVRRANRVVFERSLSSIELRGMGTTLVALALVTADDEERLCIVNVGDSRGYVLQDGKLVQITRDHSYVEDLVELGEISREEARNHPKKNLVTRALGVDPEIDVDAWEVMPFPGDRYLLCSDGLSNEVSDDEVIAVLTAGADAQEAADELTRMANERGGHDNISVVIVDVTADELMAAATGQTTTLPAVTADAAPAAAAADPNATTAVPAVGAPATEAPAAPETAIPAAPATEEKAKKFRKAEKPKKAKKPKDRKRRRLPSGRAVGFVTLVLAVAAVAIGAIAYYGRSGYFVAFADDNVAIYKGRPGGLLWLEPTVETTYAITRDMLPDSRVTQIAGDYEFENKESAEQYVADRLDEATTTTVAPTTTTLPPTTTTTTPGTTLPPEAQVVTTTIAATAAPPPSSVGP